MAQSVTSLRRTSLVAIGGKADIGRSCCLLGPTRLTQRRSGRLLDDFIRECEHRGRGVEAKSLGSRERR